MFFVSVLKCALTVQDMAEIQFKSVTKNIILPNYDKCLFCQMILLMECKQMSSAIWHFKRLYS